MAWEHLAIDKPHLVYIILGGFTSLFMLCSSVIKERFYIGEASVATIVGLIFGPHAAGLIVPDTWGNTDKITLEFSRIVLVVQCFAVGVELPKNYMEKHWKSVVFLLVPVMTFGWLITSLFIWGLFHSHLNWLDSLVVAACVTATDPVLASSVVGKGKFAKRVPKHLRDLLSCESGCNDGMAFPFVYLAVYLTRYRPHANEVALHWFCYTILYECIFGAIYGFTVGYIARRAIRYSHEKDLIDRESFLVFYFVLALFCAGSGSLLGMDDLLIGFACGVGFSNDGWFTEKTEEAHVSNVIDLLINLAFFVYLGSIIPWEQFQAPVIGTSAWKMVVLALLVLFFRRIPIMLLLKPVIPDVKTWREALFAGHFGPIGVGAIFVAILARAELETESTTPLSVLPEPGFEHLNIIELIWPITTFLVITSIIVHGSSIAVFTLGKHINTLTVTMSYTQANEESGNWMDRLPRIQSRSKSTMSLKKLDSSSESLEEKLPDYPSDTLALPRNFLRRQTEEDTPTPFGRARSRRRKTRSSNRPGGPVSDTAIAPRPRDDELTAINNNEKSESATLYEKSEESPDSIEKAPEGQNVREEPEEEIYEEGPDTIYEDEQGNVLEVTHSSKNEPVQERREKERAEARRLFAQEQIKHGVANGKGAPLEEAAGDGLKKDETETQDFAAAAGEGNRPGWKSMKKRVGSFAHPRKPAEDGPPKVNPPAQPARRHGPARAFRFGRTIIVEDEDGEVIKKYEIPAPEQSDRKQSYVDPERTKQRLKSMGSWLGVGAHGEQDQGEAGKAGQASSRPQGQRKKSFKFNANHETDRTEDEDDLRVRFTMNGNDRRMSKHDFIKQIQSLDPSARASVVEDSNVPEMVKREARADAMEANIEQSAQFRGDPASAPAGGRQDGANNASAAGEAASEDRTADLTMVDSNKQDIPFHPVSAEVEKVSRAEPTETAAQRRRRLADEKANAPASTSASTSQSPSPGPRPRHSVIKEEEDSDDDGTERVPPSARRRRSPAPRRTSSAKADSDDGEGETAAERRRREGALGLTRDENDSDEDESRPRQPPKGAVPGNLPGSSASPAQERRGIRFADEERGKEKGRERFEQGGAAEEGRSSGGGRRPQESGRHVGWGRIKWNG